MKSFATRRFSAAAAARTVASRAVFRAAVRSLVVAGLLLGGFTALARAADVSPRVAPNASEPLFRPARPYWLELTPLQRQALGPLASDWEHIDAQTKKKWVEIANRYPKMRPDEQNRSQERMREWTLLTPEQRRVARDSFERVRAMPPEQRADMLRKYQELPPERRAALVHQGVASKAIVMPKALVASPEATVPRRTQIKEGASVRNPVIAAQKSASPVVAPAMAPSRPSPKGIVAPAPAPAPATPSAPISFPPAVPAAASVAPGPTPPANSAAPVAVQPGS